MDRNRIARELVTEAKNLVSAKTMPWKEFFDGNDNPAAFATNKFRSTRNALRFFQRLEAAGAKDIMVTGIYDEPGRITREGGPYADTILFKVSGEVGTLMTFILKSKPDEFHSWSGGQFRLWWD